MLAANFIFACCTFSLKVIPADMFDIMIVRFTIQSVGFGFYAVFYKHYDVFNTNGQPIACALNISMSCGTNLTYLAALYFLPLSDLNTIKYTYIVWTAILSVIFLKDRFKFVNGIALILTIVGCLLSTRSEFFMKTVSHLFNKSTLNTTANTTSIVMTDSSTCMISSSLYYLGIIFAFMSSLTKAIQVIARKQLISTKLPHSIMNVHFTTAALIISIIYSIIRRFWQPGPYPWKWMFTAGVAIGFFQLITNTFYAKALKRESVQLLSILGTLDILYACLLQYIFLRLAKPWMFFVGALFIVISAIILSVDSYLTNEKQEK